MLRNDAKKLLKLIRPYSVNQLYKYRSMNCDSILDIFINNKIFLSSPTNFNDPFESRPLLTYHKSVKKRSKYLRELTKDRFPNTDNKTLNNLMKGKDELLTNSENIRKVYNSVLSTIGIYCLSEINDDLLMWAHYSDSHRGFCLEFDSSNNNTIFWEAFKVIYKNDYPLVNVMDIENPDEYPKIILRKSKHWKYEREWRIIKNEQDGGPGHYQFSPELLKGVIFGAMICKKDEDLLNDLIKKYPCKLNRYRAILNKKEYKLDICPVS